MARRYAPKRFIKPAWRSVCSILRRSSFLPPPIIDVPRTIGSMPSSLPFTVWNASRWLLGRCALSRNNSKCWFTNAKPESTNKPASAIVVTRITIKAAGLPPILHVQRRQRLEQLQSQIGQLDRAIDALLGSDPQLSQHAKLLCTIPGIARRTAAKLLAELAGKEFSSARQLAAYAGLTPEERRSGQNLYGKTRLSKIGNAFLRKALFMPASVTRRWCMPIAKWANSLEARHLEPLQIRGAVMRKLLHLVFGVLRHQQPFNPVRTSRPTLTHVA